MADEQPQENVVVTRIIDAPVELVWKAWTEPDYIKRWWGPAHFTAPHAEVDLHEGGRFLFAMQAPPEQGGAIHYTAGTYQKIVPMELLEIVQNLSDEEGNPIDPTSVGMPQDFPRDLRMRLEFKAIRSDMTELVITEYGWKPGQMMVYSYAGMHQSLDKMKQELSA